MPKSIQLNINMESKDIYLHVASNNSLDYFPWNTNNNFTVKLPSKLSLDQGLWEVALMQIRCPASKTKSQIFIKTDIIYDGIDGHNMSPILRWMEITTRAKHYDVQLPFYHTIRKKHIDEISFKIESTDSQAHSFNNSRAVQCVLHIRQKNKE